MCWFITIGIDTKRAGAIEAVGRERGGFGVRRSVNPHLAAMFPSADALFEITHGQCSCDLVERESSEDQESVRRQYQKKGWSEAKIARALTDRQRAHEASRLHRANTEARTRLRALIIDQAGQAGGVRLFAHFYKGSPDEEVVTSVGSRQVAAAGFALSSLEKGVLVDVQSHDLGPGETV